MEYSKVFISQLESKVKELQNSNRLYKLKLLSTQESVDSTAHHDGAGNQNEVLQTRPGEHPGRASQNIIHRMISGPGSQLVEMSSRLLSLEMKILEMNWRD